MAPGYRWSFGPAKRLVLSLVAVASLALPATASALEFEIVNESGQPASKVYVTVTGTDFDVPGMEFGVPKPLDEANPLTINTLKSGRIYISYNTPVHESELYTLFRSTTRFDWVELTVTPDPTDKANLTAIEQSGIGMRLDTFGAGKHLEELGSANSDTIFQALQQIPGGPAATVRNGDEIVRVISPSKAATYPDLADAYPDLGDYVRSLSGQTISLHTAFFGTSSFVTSTYSGTFAPDGSIVLTGTSNPAGQAPAQISFQGDQLIADVETGEGTPNTLEGTIRRDVLSGFSAGFWGGKYGNNAIDFCTDPNTTSQGTWCPKGFNQPAFGDARASLSPFPTCEQYAAVINKYADVYGNPYSDASGKVQIGIAQPGHKGEVETLRLTILPDSGSAMPVNSGNPNCGAAAPAPPPAAPPAASTAAPPAASTAARVKLFKLFKKGRVKGRRARVGRIVCAGPCGRVKLIAKKGRRVIGRARYSLKGAKGPLTLRLTGAGKRLLSHRRRVKLRVLVWVTPSGGRTLRRQRKVLLIEKSGRKRHRRHR